MEQNNADTMIKLKELEGKWYIIYSNFPMWLKGDKTSPTFNYTIVQKKKGTRLLDKVEYTKNGKTKSIDGIDKPLNDSNTKFIWRGNGIMRILKSEWSIKYIDPKKEWAIIYFEKTLFTPKGYDVISRSKQIDSITEQKIKEKLSELKIKEKLTKIAQH